MNVDPFLFEQGVLMTESQIFGNIKQSGLNCLDSVTFMTLASKRIILLRRIWSKPAVKELNKMLEVNTFSYQRVNQMALSKLYKQGV